MCAVWDDGDNDDDDDADDDDDDDDDADDDWQRDEKLQHLKTHICRSDEIWRKMINTKKSKNWRKNICRRDLESLCKELDLGYTADAVLPNDHRY